MDLGRLLLRLVIGGTFIVHGTQKLKGWFGGYGPDGTGQFMEGLGLRPGRKHAMAAGATETAGGALIALGLATPAAAAGITGVMITALRTVIWKDGVKPATGEFELALAAGAIALAETGPGRPSLDDTLGIPKGKGMALAALVAGAAGSAYIMSNTEPAPAPSVAEPTTSPASPASGSPQTPPA